jgi:hypothetical protein
MMLMNAIVHNYKHGMLHGPTSPIIKKYILIDKLFLTIEQILQECLRQLNMGPITASTSIVADVKYQYQPTIDVDQFEQQLLGDKNNFAGYVYQFEQYDCGDDKKIVVMKIVHPENFTRKQALQMKEMMKCQKMRTSYQWKLLMNP